MQKLYTPRRRYKRRDNPPADEILQIKSTLLEYGNIPDFHFKMPKDQDSQSSAEVESLETNQQKVREIMTY